MKTLRTKILPFLGLAVLLFVITLSYHYNQFLLTEILISAAIIGCLALIKIQSKVKRTSPTSYEAIKTKTTKHELSNSYSEQYS